MATTNFADSASVEGGCTVFTGDRVVNLFPWHDVVKVDEGTFIQWFLDGTLPPPSRFIQSPDGSLVPNPSALVFT
ncbi:hypothetical protein J1N35_021514 [Gossypium stocksii]|uniref:Uncharacterized protein n=1 Tax=Gossypium stocksii TaxID=47602 RepID=A0A9D3VF03_9ROSI|nr:hypothetical protein J1N35_021514 [Gossypium stocksii]